MQQTFVTDDILSRLLSALFTLRNFRMYNKIELPQRDLKTSDDAEMITLLRQIYGMMTFIQYDMLFLRTLSTAFV